MSGHSHAKTIKHQKEITDQKRGQMFSKLSRMISVAVKEKGPSPETNYKLKIAIETAHTFNMPKENIERAISRASGEGAEEKLEEFIFEAYGPGGIAIIAEGITDNRNRTLGDFKQALNQYGGKMVAEGSVRWMFDRKGVIIINIKDQVPEIKNEEMELKAIEAGAEDLYWHDDVLDIYTKPEDLEKVKKSLEEKGTKTDSVSLDWIAKEEVEADEKTKEANQKLFEILDENDSIQEVYSNLKN